MKQTSFLRLLCLLLFTAVVFSFTACGQVEDPTDSSVGSEWVLFSTETNDETTTDQNTSTSSGENSSDSISNGGASDSATDTATGTATDTATDQASASQSTQTLSTSSATSTEPTDSGSSSSTTDTGSKNTSTSTTTSSSQPTANTDIAPVAPENYYGRTWLLSQSEGAALVQDYDALAAGIENLKTKISLPNKLTEEQFNTVYNCYRADYPQHFWLGKEYFITKSENKIVSFVPEYTMDAQTKASEQKKFNNAVKNFLSGINKTMTQYEIEKTIHDRLVLSCQYSEGAHAHDAYGALVNRVAVCEGYALAFEHLCRSVGIQTLFVCGTSYNPQSGQQENHAWNIVQIDGQYYHTDTTWDDAGEPDETNLHYAWFDVTTDRIKEDHVLIQEGYSYPNCTATSANYHKKNGSELKTLNVEDVVRCMKKQGSSFIFKGYVVNLGNPEMWLDQNFRDVGTRLGLNGYTVSMTRLGHEIIFIFTPT